MHGWLPPRRTASLLLFTLTLAGTSAVRAQEPATIHGRVTGPDNAPIRGATVTVTARDSSRSTPRVMRTTDAGQYSFPVLPGVATYGVAVAMLGYSPQTRTVRSADAAVAVDFRLVAVAQQLAAVTTRGQRQKPTRSDREITGAGEAGSATGTSGGLTGDLTGDITAAMATIPGLVITPDATGGLPAISAFGLSADQNSLTLNGMNFGVGSMPRDGLTLRVAQSTYDPGRGGFSGVQTSLRLPSGGNLLSQIVHVTHEDPNLQGNPPAAAALGTQYSRQIVSGSFSGPVIEDKAYYNTSFQFSRRASDLPSLLGLDAATLRSLGVSNDSIAKFIAAAGSLGMPTQGIGVPSERLSKNGSGLLRLDWSPNTTSRSGNQTYLLLGGNVSDNGGVRSAATALSSHGGESRSWSGQAQLTASRYRGPVLNESNVSFVRSNNETSPYLSLPDARILLNSAFADGSAASATIRGGGNPSGVTNSRSASVQGRNETSWFTWDNRHQIKVTLDGRLDHSTNSSGQNSLGTFGYNSLADFTANTPSSFTRNLGVRETRGSQFLGAVGLGDAFRRNQQQRYQYGLRLEVNRFGMAPPVNSAIVTAFGRSTDHVPSSVTVAPMLGFTRSYARHRGGSFSGGVREYVGTLSSQAVENVSRFTGLTDAVQQINCVGSAVPTPQWSTYASAGAIPSTCVGSSGFSQNTPAVSLFDAGYESSRRWGAALAWTGRLSQHWSSSIASNYSLNLHRSGSVDINFDPTQRFTLDAEGGRPVFVPTTSIVGSSGAVASTGSRRFSQFATVSQLQSDLRSTSTQLVFGLWPVASGRPVGFRTTASFRAYYTMSFSREQTRGFGGTTNGDPRDVAWQASALPRHSFQLLGSLKVPKWVNIDAFGRISSGRSFTPMVGSDINGDGFSNDRAFVFPTSATGAGAGMQSLLATSPEAARRCLDAQMGRVASANSCNGPWTQSLNMAIGPDAMRFGFGNRGSIALVVSNALAAADRLLHGADKLHYWGTAAVPDQTLLNVKGFDPATRQFTYTVNPSFGSTTASRSTGRVPFVISLDVRWRLGPDLDAQMLKGFLKPTRADATPVLTAEQVKDRLDKDAQNNFQQIARRKDALRLDPRQVAALGQLAGRFDKYRDSVYTGLSRYLASLRGNYLTRDAKKRFHDDFVAIAHLYVESGSTVRALLTEEQFASLPPDEASYFAMDEETFQRLMRAADFGSLLELITGEGID